MNSETLLLSAYAPPIRERILAEVDISFLRAVLQRTSLSQKECLDRIANSDDLSSQIELTISHVNF
jgi:hypothetical protein